MAVLNASCALAPSSDAPRRSNSRTVDWSPSRIARRQRRPAATVSGIDRCAAFQQQLDDSVMAHLGRQMERRAFIDAQGVDRSAKVEEKADNVCAALQGRLVQQRAGQASGSVVKPAHDALRRAGSEQLHQFCQVGLPGQRISGLHPVGSLIHLEGMALLRVRLSSPHASFDKAFSQWSGRTPSSLRNVPRQSCSFESGTSHSRTCAASRHMQIVCCDKGKRPVQRRTAGLIWHVDVKAHLDQQAYQRKVALLDGIGHQVESRW